MNYTTTTNYRKNAKCVACGVKLNGAPAVPVTLEQTGDKVRYIALSEWQRVYTLEQATEHIAGTPVKRGVISRAVFTPKHPERVTAGLHAYYITGNSSAPRWYPTAGGAYASPSYFNLKWHKRLIKMLGEHFTPGVFAVEFATYDGERIGTLVCEFANRNELGQWLAKDKRIDKAKILADAERLLESKGY